MKFHSEKDRLKHPQIGLIPKAIWESQFSAALSRDELTAMQCSREELVYHFRRLVGESPIKKLRFWLCCAFRAPELIDSVGDDPASNHKLSRAANWLRIDREFKIIGAAQLGRMSTFNYFCLEAGDDLARITTAHHFMAFISTASLGHLDIMNRLFELAPKQVPDMIKADEFRAFRLAALNGHRNVMNRLMELAPELVLDMIKADSCHAFRSAARNGDLELMNRLMELAPEQVEAFNGHAFRSAAANGHLHIMNRLIELAPEQVKEMIEAYDFHPFRLAASNGHFDVMNRLIQLAPNQIQAMIKALNYDAFCMAASNGHLDVINRLIQLAPNHIQAMIKAVNFDAFCLAASNGHLDILNRLIQLAPNQVQAIFKANGFDVFHRAVSNGHLDILNRLVELVPEHVQDMIKANDFAAFRTVVHNGHLNVINRLLSFPEVFVYAAAGHDREHILYVQPFMMRRLKILQQRKEGGHPTVVVTKQEAKLCFYFLRHLMRAFPTTENTLAHIDFLISIPIVKTLLHRDITEPTVYNELLRNVIYLRNQLLIERLLAIPAVNEQARRDHFYQAEISGNIDLRALCAFAESSMMALSPLEQTMLARLEKKYKPVIDMKGVTVVFDDVYQYIIERYHAAPAIFHRKDGTDLQLPLTKNEFLAMAQENDFSKNEKDSATTCYYQHPVHTLYRYLTRGNPWMHAQANHVVWDELTRTRSSDFETYKGLIALLWIAATDTSAPGVDGFTPETRTEEWIKNMALIGRAHNWDKPARLVLNAVGQPELNKNGRPKTRQYDDLEADKPSCFGGVKRRLFQSLIGHPLYVQDIRPVIEAVFREKLREHMFTQLETASTCGLEAVYVEYLRMTEGESEELILQTITQNWDVPEETLDEWERELNTQYGDAFGKWTVLALVRSVRNDFLAHATSLGQFVALLERCQLISLCQDELEKRTDGLLNKLRGQSPEERMLYLNEADDWTGGKRITHAIYLGLLDEVAVLLGRDAFTQLLCPDPETMEFYANLLAPYAEDARLEKWLSGLEDSIRTMLLAKIVPIHQQKIDASSSAASSDSSDEEIESSHNETPSIQYEQLPDDLTGQLLIEMDAARLHPGSANPLWFFNYRASGEAPNQQPSP